MTDKDLLDLYRSQTRDVEEPYLWSPKEVLAYMDDAQNMFCRLTDGISDGTTPSVVRLVITPNIKSVALHPSILKIRSAILESSGDPVSILNNEDMAARNMRWDGRTGPLKALIEGVEENSIRPWPLPNFTDTVLLTVFRRPLRCINKIESRELEIGAHHHQHLLKWMEYRGYSKQDAQTLDKQRAQTAKTEFEDYCAMVKKEQENKRHKVRTVAYGGIPHFGAQYGDNWFTGRRNSW